MRVAFFYHTSRHKCRARECEVREVLSLARDIVSEWLEREMATSSPAPAVRDVHADVVAAVGQFAQSRRHQLT